jgi:hypothetical protein
MLSRKKYRKLLFLGKGIPNPEKQEKCLFIPLAVGKLRDRFAPSIHKKIGDRNSPMRKAISDSLKSDSII